MIWNTRCLEYRAWDSLRRFSVYKTVLRTQDMRHGRIVVAGL